MIAFYIILYIKMIAMSKSLEEEYDEFCAEIITFQKKFGPIKQLCLRPYYFKIKGINSHQTSKKQAR
uniref:Uncharacterized protein n=1 Tax=Megaselia scalaris TaxID=36166 RepID=T1H3L7_MEGSC